MLGSGAPPGGWLKTAGSSSSSVDDAGVGWRVGLGGLQDVAADSGAGWSFTSGLLDAGSRAAGDRARLACRGGGGGGGGGCEAWEKCLSATFCLHPQHEKQSS